MPIPYVAKVNKRTIGSEVLIVNELHVVGITSLNTVIANYIRLIEVPLQETPSTVIVPGFTETTLTPGTTEFRVDFTSGRIEFNPVNNGSTVFVTYKGRGSVVDAEDINEVQQPLASIANLDGTLSAGIVKPNNISTVLTDDFTFPRKVIVNGDLDVKGTTTTIESTIITFEDPLLELNYNNPANPTTFKAGLKIIRPSLPSAQLDWDEALLAWAFKDTSGVSIMQAFNAGYVSIPELRSPLVRSDTSMILDIDRDNNSTSETFTWRTNSALTLMSLNETGDLSVSGNVTAASLSGPVLSTSLLSNTSLTYGIDEDGNSTAELHLWRTNGSLELMRLAEDGHLSLTGTLTTTGNVGVGVSSPAAKLHNTGGTILGLTTATVGPVLAAVVNSFSGVVFTTSTAVTITLPTPTDTTSGRFFSLLHKASSTGTLNVNGSNVGVGKGSTYMWDSVEWVAVGATGGFQVMAGNPASPVQGDTWFDSVTSQFKGYNGTNNVILG